MPITNIVLCDLGLPGMTGYEVAQAIRKDVDLRGIALIAISGFGQPSDCRRGRSRDRPHHIAYLGRRCAVPPG